MRHTCLIALLVISACSFSTGFAAPDSDIATREARRQVLRGTLGTYCGMPRRPDMTIEVEKLVEQLVDVKAQVYSICVHWGERDWDDLQTMLPMLRKHGINVWASIVPPSESKPRLKMDAEPFKQDYVRWAEEIAKLSLREPNLVAWSIDDFTHNLQTYTPEYTKRMLDAAQAINPKLAFVPCSYYKAITPEFAKVYAPMLDGILFPYRHESGGSNLKEWDLVESEVKRVRELCGEGFPVVIDVYATAHSKLGPSTPEYVEQVMILGRQFADGVLIYKHQDPVKERPKYEIIKRLFTKWSAEARPAPSTPTGILK
jgi:hypothetical protein